MNENATDAEVEQTARTVALMLRDAVTAEGSLRDPAAWVAGLTKMGAKLSPAEFDDEDAPPGVVARDGTIVYNINATDDALCRFFAREGSMFLTGHWEKLDQTKKEQLDAV